MAVTIAIETPLQDDVRELVSELNVHLLPLSPLEFQFKMTVEQMAGADTTLFVARNEVGEAVGCGALKVISDQQGEVKRMYTRPSVRGQRVGSALLEAITELARQKATAWPRPTGSMPAAVLTRAAPSSTTPIASGRRSSRSTSTSPPSPEVAGSAAPL